ncbi:MAG: alkaline phosphatase family protein [Acidobacteriota bacterium]|nr:MAG: alkaline phosphatase family protein [Acidobacteriota bacterium]
MTPNFPKYIRVFARLTLISICCFVLAVFAHAQQPGAKRALIISIDGLDTRYIQDPDKYGLKIPTLRRLIANGVTAKGMRSVYPSVTYPNHTALVTGTTPSRNGIVGNGIFEDPAGTRTGAWFWYSTSIKADTLWDSASRAGMTFGSVSWPVSVGAGDWNVPEIWAPGGSVVESRRATSENSRPRGLVEEIERADRDLYSGVTADEGDDMRTRFAEHIIRNKAPNLMLVHIFDLDHFEHEHGPFTKEAISILEKTDGYVARMLKAYEEAGTLQETAVFITSDHGFKPISKNINPGVLLAREGLADVETVKDDSGRDRTAVKTWKAAVYPNAAYCAVYVKDWKDEASLGQLRTMFKELEGKEGSGIHKVYDATEVRLMGGDPLAAFVLDPADGYSCGGSYGGEYITETGSKGTHGYHPDRNDFLASFIASGPGVTRRGKIDVIDMIDVGPTIAKLLGIELRDATGKAVELGR